MTALAQKVRTVRWSASKLGQLLGCPEQFRLERIVDVESRFRASSLVFGSCIHDALAEMSYARRDGESFGLRQLHDVFRDSWNDALRDPTQPPVRFGKKEDETSMLQLGLSMLRAFHDNQPPDSERVVAVEQKVEVPLFEERGVRHVLLGYYDLVSVHDDGTVIVSDWKTASRAPTRAQVDGSLQRGLYCLALASIYPDVPVEFRIRAVTKSAKKPVFIEIISGPKPNDGEQLIELVRSAHALVTAGSFMPADPMSWRWYLQRLARMPMAVMTVCDICSDHSNSAPGLQCGRVDEEGDEPCRGIYQATIALTFADYQRLARQLAWAGWHARKSEGWGATKHIRNVLIELHSRFSV